MVNCGLTARTPGSAPGLTLGNEYGRTLPCFTFCLDWWRLVEVVQLVPLPDKFLRPPM